MSTDDDVYYEPVDQYAVYYDEPATSGWVVFSGVMIGIASMSSLIYGLTLLANDDWVVIAPDALVRFDTTTVGVIALIFAAFQAFVAMGVFQGELWARVLGIIGASLAILSQMSFMSVYPAWSWLIIILNGLVIYGLSVHGDEVAEW
ncbi:MAG: DUF7144 family membrane protein [Acidimicrobiales bacterium]